MKKVGLIFFFFLLLYYISDETWVRFDVWDFPGQLDYFDSSFDLESIFGGTGCLVFVIDAQEDYTEALTKLNQTISKA